MLDLPNFFIAPHAIVPIGENEPVLVALSGGADSSLLLRLIYQDSNGKYPVMAAHVNHGIRDESYGGEADRDEQFCREICKKLGIKLFVLSASVPELARKSGNSLETEARNLRYSFFADVMRQNNIRILATAHNADDNLETQIFNLSRGCGTEGIAGIPRSRSFDGVEGGIIVRPILDAAKSEVIEYCNANEIEFVTDSTNLVADCTRNRIRHNVIPELSSLFGTPQRSSMRLSRAAREDCDYILSEAEKFLSSHPTLYCQDISSLHIALKKRVLMLWFAQHSGKSLEAVHVDALVTLADKGREGYSLSLPDKKRVLVRLGALAIGDDTRGDFAESPEYCVNLCDGLNHISDTPFTVFVTTSQCLPDTVETETGEIRSLYASARLDNIERSTLSARNRQAGDTVQDGNMNKKLKKLMCDRGVALSDRDTLPIICTDDSIAYVPLCAVADRNKSKSGKFEYNIGIYK